MIIYKATNSVTGKVYIGQTIKSLAKRRSEHIYNSKRGCDSYFYKSVNKYGSDIFEWDVLCECDTKEELDEMEFHYIRQYKISTGVYNLTDGGDGSHGRLVSTETKKKMSEANKGRQISDDLRKKFSENRRGENNPNYGNKMSDESKARISEANKGRIKSVEERRKKSDIFSGDGNPSAKYCEIRSPDGDIYKASTRKEICDRFGLNPTHISSVLNGKRNHHKGWTRVEE